MSFERSSSFHGGRCYENMDGKEEEDDAYDEDQCHTNPQMEIEYGTLAEQKEEPEFDARVDADDDLEKGRLKFPRKLYGRDKELLQLHEIYLSLEDSSSCSSSTSHVVFLQGYSGTGKAALVQELVQQIRHRSQQKHHNNNSTKPSLDVTDYFYIAIKFDEMHSGDPFYSMQHALDAYMQRMMTHFNPMELSPLCKLLKRSDLDATVLAGTLIPSLTPLLDLAKTAHTSSSFSTQANKSATQAIKIATVSGLKESMPQIPESASSQQRTDFNSLKFHLCHFVEALATFVGQPMIWFLEDLQWANEASFQLLSALMMAPAKSASSILWIGSYPSSISASEPKTFGSPTIVLDKFLSLITPPEDNDPSTTAAQPPVTHLELFNLSPHDIAQFLVDCIDKSLDEVQQLAEAMYAKTLGNMFYVKQALEELVRQNALYYDNISFEWTVALNSVEQLEQVWADTQDVVAMVQCKLQTLPAPLPRVLAVAAYTNHFIDLNFLFILVCQEEQVEVESVAKLQELMELAFEKGLVLHAVDRDHPVGPWKYYKFAHDRIQEAARVTVPEGPERDQLLIRISNVLLDRTVVLSGGGAGFGSAGSTGDWRLFSAARNLNSVPAAMTSPMELVQLNLAVGKLAAQRGAFHEAVVFLRAGASRLDPNSCWADDGWYPLTLDLKNHSAEAEHFLGHEDVALEICQEIFEQAKTISEKSRAHVCYIEALNGKHNNNHSVSCDAALDVLEEYGLNVPRNPSKFQVRMERWRLSAALHGRPLLCIADFPVASDPAETARIQLAFLAMSWGNMAGRAKLVDVLTRRVLRLSLRNQVITKDLPLIFCTMGFNFRREQKYGHVIAFTNAALKIMGRFPEERGLEFIKAKTTGTAMNCIRSPFRDSIDDFLHLSKIMIIMGETVYGNGSALSAMLGYFLSSLRLDSMLEHKLLDLEEKANNIGRRSFGVLFALMRQTLYNLQGGSKASPSPCEVNGAAYNEEQIQGSLDGDARKMNNRDIGILRLMLAVIFDDEMAMEEMLNRLDAYPLFDVVVQREHMRMTFTGFAALILRHRLREGINKHEGDAAANKSGNDKRYNKWIKMAFGYFTKLSRFGSANAQPVVACLSALLKPSAAAFTEAIHICAEQALYNLCAFMHEHWGFMLLEQLQQQNRQQRTKEETAAMEEQFKCALWVYNDWGAWAKVEQLQSRHEFLGGRNVFQQEAPPSQLSSLRRKATVSLATQNLSSDLYP